ncbi:diguanylate cyclase [Actinotalea ferrariae]|uniref:GGDEF domain-containing protein n=1 Tax=Actinotalea ferrariae TaxID=1386098 RepID=UPI001C8C5EC6|nr:GGDEF domain-containing protein [Actinotalea ferrariae]MBX9244799.1 diguanylate cyclase [Actinotalea ferrariae]
MTTTPAPHEPDAVPDLTRRLEEVVAVIQELAALRFGARATVTAASDIVDAVAAGVNALGEELAASYDEIEQRVADRTAELAVATQELRRRALHDDLTGLANRTAFWDRLAHRLDVGDGPRTRCAVLFLDLDDFKTVNDTLGHRAGDQLLVDVARRITSQLRAGDLAARVGGDEFVVLLDDVATADAALTVAHRISEALRAPHELGGHRYTAASSIGVAVGPDGLDTPDAIVAAADAAMYDAKRRGSDACVVYDRERHGQASTVDVVPVR